MPVHIEHHLTSIEEAKQHYEYYRDRLEEQYATPHCILPDVQEIEEEMRYWKDEYESYKPLSL